MSTFIRSSPKQPQDHTQLNFGENGSKTHAPDSSDHLLPLDASERLHGSLVLPAREFLDGSIGLPAPHTINENFPCVAAKFQQRLPALASRRPGCLSFGPVHLGSKLAESHQGHKNANATTKRLPRCGPIAPGAQERQRHDQTTSPMRKKQ